MISSLFVILLNSTWGAIQSSLGLLLFLCFIRKPHFRYKGAVVTTNAVLKHIKFKGGISLGIFIFVTREISKEQLRDSALIRHEYGHCLQSVLLGPLYLLIIGLPSITWNILFKNWRKKHNKRYSWLYTESWADKWGRTGIDHIC